MTTTQAPRQRADTRRTYLPPEESPSDVWGLASLSVQGALADDEPMTDDVERPVGAGRDDEGSTPWRVVLAALKPWAAFVVALGVVDVGRGTAAFASNIIVPVAYLGFVGLPSAVPVLIAKPGWMRIAVSMAMTAVALISSRAHGDDGRRPSGPRGPVGAAGRDGPHRSHVRLAHPRRVPVAPFMDPDEVE
jgi:hypothetical protein